MSSDLAPLQEPKWCCLQLVRCQCVPFQEDNEQDEARLCLLRQEVGQECLSQSYIRGVIGVYLVDNFRNVYGFWLGEVHDILNSGVEEDAVEIRMTLDHLLSKSRNLIEVPSVKCNASDLVGAVALHESTKAVLASSSRNHVYALTGETLSELKSKA